MLREILRLTDRMEADAVPQRAGPGRRLLMAGVRTDRRAWTWVSPEVDAAERALPGPWSLTLLLRGRRSAGSPP